MLLIPAGQGRGGWAWNSVAAELKVAACRAVSRTESKVCLASRKGMEDLE